MTAPAWVNNGSGIAVATSGVIALPYPASMVVGNLLIAVVGWEHTGTIAAHTPPAGWNRLLGGTTLSHDVGISPRLRMAIDYRWVASGLTGTVTWSVAATDVYGFMAQIIMNGQTHGPPGVEGISVANSNGGAPSSRALVTSGAERLGLHIAFHSDDNFINNYGYASWTKRINFSSSVGQDMYFLMNSVTRNTAGTLASEAASPLPTVSHHWLMAAFALYRPPRGQAFQAHWQ